jgi:hypothetical protein
VHGRRKGVPIHKKGDRVASHATVAFEGGVSVAGKAVLVRSAWIVKNPPLLMGGVTIHTGRDFVGLLLPEPALDDLDMHRLDPSVTGGAGGGHVVVVDTRAGIGVGKDVVGGMT